ncbi:PnuC-like nicotinamide mononucleotide transport [Vibrio phage 11895-B1]|uniref:PnuC-like nicotinamide mononucleotide transport n=1 Tax=Vibrio phage 11895-B1 TaxID=754075 RepID=UPI0002C1311A|nr:PnuC-like nicotinamide mononucleotide transport [Vibrio phage 11895-B1]AGH32133.1 nicotinamide riboside transporter [Vibrio phage 11895-B1]
MEMIKAFTPSTIIKDLTSLTVGQVSFLSAMLVTMLGLSLYWQDSMVSMVSGVTGVICVFLVNMRKLSNFFWGFINCSLYGYVAYTASYYGDTMLNWVFYLPIQLVGAYMWSAQMNGNEVVSRKIKSLNTLFVLLAGSITTVLVYSQALQMIGGKLSIVDATTTTLSVLATYFMVKGYREQWVCWIVVNILSIYMWVQNFITNGDGYGVLIMWVMFLTNSVYGCYTWFKASK